MHSRVHGIFIYLFFNSCFIFVYVLFILNVVHSGVKPLLGRFSELEVLLSDMNIQPCSIDAVLMDAGCSSMQMDQADRGFSLSRDGPLDMRMDGDR